MLSPADVGGGARVRRLWRGAGARRARRDLGALSPARETTARLGIEPIDSEHIDYSGYDVEVGKKSTPFSIRLSEETDRIVTAEAKRTKRSKGTIVEALAEEALKARLVPGIAFRGEDYDRRAWLIGTALDIWQIIEAHQDFNEDFDRMVGESDLTERQLRTALAYYERFPDEIDEFIASNRRSLQQLREAYPLADVIVVDVD